MEAKDEDLERDEEARRGRKPSERLFTIAVKRDAVGWRLLFARVPQSTIENHVIERTEPDVFEMMLARIDRALRSLRNG